MKRRLKLVIYDIAENRTRTKLSVRLEAIGLVRIQKSVFAGFVRRKSIRKAIRQFEPHLEPGDKLYVIPIVQSSLREMYGVGLPGELDRLTGEVHTLVL